jgi:hypothetical protein
MLTPMLRIFNQPLWRQRSSSTYEGDNNVLARYTQLQASSAYSERRFICERQGLGTESAIAYFFLRPRILIATADVPLIIDHGLRVMII